MGTNNIALALAAVELVARVGEAAAAAYLRHKEQRGEDVTAAEIETLLRDHRPPREVLAGMGVEI